MKKIPILLSTLVLGACASVGPFAGKVVADKQQPNRLIAADGSECLVAASRFESTEIGMRVLCMWQGGVQPAPARARR